LPHGPCRRARASAAGRKHGPGPSRSWAGSERIHARSAASDLAGAGAGRTLDDRGAEPARAMGETGGDAFRPRSALLAQPDHAALAGVDVLSIQMGGRAFRAALRLAAALAVRGGLGTGGPYALAAFFRRHPGGGDEADLQRHAPARGAEGKVAHSRDRAAAVARSLAARCRAGGLVLSSFATAGRRHRSQTDLRSSRDWKS